MSGKIEKLTIKPEFFKMMQDKLEDEGWTSVRQFTLANYSSLMLSTETTRRVFIPCEYKSLEAYTVANVMTHLNFTRTEIRQALKDYTNDPLMWKLIGGDDDKANLTPKELAIVGMVRKLAEKSPEVINTVSSMLTSIAPAYGVDLSEFARRITKSDKRKK